MAKGDNIYKNMSGYNDPTARAAIQHTDHEIDKGERGRVNEVLSVMRLVASVAGFEVEGRIVLKDKKTCRVWR